MTTKRSQASRSRLRCGDGATRCEDAATTSGEREHARHYGLPLGRTGLVWGLCGCGWSRDLLWQNDDEFMMKLKERKYDVSDNDDSSACHLAGATILSLQVIFFAPGACRWSKVFFSAQSPQTLSLSHIAPTSLSLHAQAKQPIPGGNAITSGWSLDQYHAHVSSRRPMTSFVTG